MKRTSNHLLISQELQGEDGVSRPNLIDGKELASRLNAPSQRILAEMRRKRMIPYIKLGHRTIRYSWPRVLEALSRFEIRAVGDK